MRGSREGGEEKKGEAARVCCENEVVDRQNTGLRKKKLNAGTTHV